MSVHLALMIESITKQNQDFYNKHFDKEKVRAMLDFADSLGLYTVGNFIIGSPYDSIETVEENLQYAIESKLDVVNIKTLDYMMGSELYDTLPAEKQAHIPSESGLVNRHHLPENA